MSAVTVAGLDSREDNDVILGSLGGGRKKDGDGVLYLPTR
mgnify:CR=1 FL=1